MRTNLAHDDRSRLTHRLCHLIVLALLPMLSACALLEIQRGRSELAMHEDLVYAPGSHNPRHRLDLIMPREAWRPPVVVFVHGGYWNSQDKAYYQAFTGLYANIGQALARQGIGTAVIDYRIAPEVGIEGELADVAAAIRWTQDQVQRYGGDPRKLVLAGHSAGGHMVALLGYEREKLRAAGVDPDAIRGLVPMSAILDIPDMEANSDQAFNASTTWAVFGHDRERQQAFSPRSYFRADAPPALFIYGEADYPYLRAQNQRAEADLSALGAQAQFQVAPAYRHEDLVLQFGKPLDPVADAVAEFVRRVTR